MIRVLHVVENFNGQAVESWLTRAVSHEAYECGQWQFDFFLLGVGRGDQAGTVLRKGCVLHEGNPGGGASLPQLARALRGVVTRGGYAIVHIHQDVLAGVFALALLGTGARILTHAHNCHQRLPVGGVWKERVLTAAARWLTLRLSDGIAGVSSAALRTLTGGRGRRGRTDRVVYCGADAGRFLRAEVDRAGFRQGLGLAPDALVLLFVGRLVPEKNPEFALKVLHELRKIESRAAGVFVGKGVEEEALKADAAGFGLQDATRFLGWRSDIPEIMCGCDWFIHSGPESPMEGFGLAALEAQLAGLRLLLSQGVPADVLLDGAAYRQLSVTQPAADWARAGVELLDEPAATREEAAAALARTRMAQDAAFEDLFALYQP